MITTTKKLTPSIAIHPGEMLKDELDAINLSQKEFAKLIGLPATQLNEIIKGKRGIYADLALLIEKVLKIDASIWLNMQMNYELDAAKISKKNKARIEAIDLWQMIKNLIPTTFFKKLNVIVGNPLVDIPTIKSIYGISNLEQLASVYSESNYARFRKSEKLSIDKVNLIGWVKLVGYKATSTKVSKFDIKKQEEIITALNKIFKENKNVISKTETILAGYGIKLIILSNPEKCAVDGISFWSNGNPAIGLSLRHKRIDNFAFTIFHELGHVFNHLINDNTAEFIDLDKAETTSDYKNSKEETEANDFAKNALISKTNWTAFINQTHLYSDKAIINFSEKEKINPAIALGRFSYEKKKFNIRTNIEKQLN